jgi:hypothetical protein
MSEPTEKPIDPDVFAYESGGFSQCISGFGRNAVETIQEDFRDTGPDEEGVTPVERLRWHIGELVRWCQHFNGKAQRLEREIGKPPEGSHPDEAKPRAATWHAERLNWIEEMERTRKVAADAERENVILRTQLAAAQDRALELQRYADATEDQFRRAIELVKQSASQTETLLALSKATPDPK